MGYEKVLNIEDLKIPAEIEQQFQNSIDRGMAFLDDYLGDGWFERIDLEELDLHDATHCVCGQLFNEQGYKSDEAFIDNGYDWALKHVVEHGVPWEFEEFDHDAEVAMTQRAEAAQHLGFLIEEPDDLDDAILQHNGYDYDDPDVYLATTTWDLLTGMWEKAIEKRKAEAGVMA